MNAARAIWLHVFALLLRLYPPAMRRAFAAEMLAVASARLAAATEQGRWCLMWVGLHEARGLVAGAGAAWWALLTRGPWPGYAMLGSLLPLLLLAELLFSWNAWRVVVSYFCDLAHPAGGSRANLVACRLTTEPHNLTPWLVGALVTTVGLLLLVRWWGPSTWRRRRAVVITVALLVLARIVGHVSVPYTDALGVQRLLGASWWLQLLNVATGGAVMNVSIAALGVWPFVAAQALVRLVSVRGRAPWAAPQLRREPQRAGTGIVTVITVVLTAGGAGALMRVLIAGSDGAVLAAGHGFSLLDGPGTTSVIIGSIVGGTLLLVGIARLIDHWGAGHGLLIVLTSGVVARMYAAIGQRFQANTGVSTVGGVVLFLVMTGLLVGGVTWVMRVVRPRQHLS